ncbi:MAG TPA: T9SS type A sorting domain-containing protein [Ignavibacteria bacterium]|nr:T9SS type A sorting domain-containing protein [Ignavibacteria bacterium]HMR00471.1 T9SS type A sorting domain-containing protein [Ignavibacteria bacterium]
MKEKTQIQLKSIKNPLIFVGLEIMFSLLIISTFQSQTITFQKTILAPDIEYFTSVVQTPDEGYIAVGRKRESGIRDDMYIVRYNKFGDTLWSKTVEVELAECIIKTLDNNYLICGHEGSLVKINQNGDILQIRPFLGYDFLIITTVLQTNSGNFFICGTLRSNLDSPYLAKYDNNLNLIFDTLYNTNRFDGGFSGMILSRDSNLILVGYHKILVSSPLNLYLTKIDHSGNVFWENTFTQQPNLITRTIARTNGNNYIIGGYKFLAKFDSTGNSIWYQKIDSIFNNQINDIKLTNDNNFIMSGWLYDGNNAFARIRKIDSNGTTIWVRSHGFINRNNEIRAIQQTLDSGFICAGVTDSSSEDTYLLKVDSEGNLYPIGINIISTNLPYRFELFQNYPNPFNPKTNIKYEIPRDVNVSIKIYDKLGKEVFSYNEYKLAGSYEVQFDGTNLSSGMYFYKMVAETSQRDVFTDTKKMVLLK